MDGVLDFIIVRAGFTMAFTVVATVVVIGDPPCTGRHIIIVPDILHIIVHPIIPDLVTDLL